MSQVPISSTNSPLELTGSQLRHDVQLVMDQLAPYLDELLNNDAWTPHDAPNTRISPREPELGPSSSMPEVLAELFQRRINPSYNPGSGGYLGYVPGGGIPHVAMADLIAGIINI